MEFDAAKTKLIVINNLNNLELFALENGYVDYEEWDVCRTDVIMGLHNGIFSEEEAFNYLTALKNLGVECVSETEEYMYHVLLNDLDNVIANLSISSKGR